MMLRQLAIHLEKRQITNSYHKQTNRSINKLRCLSNRMTIGIFQPLWVFTWIHLLNVAPSITYLSDHSFF